MFKNNLLTILLSCIISYGTAQDSLKIEAWQNRIAKYEAMNRTDSVIIYSRKIADEYLKADNLEEYYYAQNDIVRWYDNTTLKSKAIAYLDGIFAENIREPNNEEEWSALQWLRVNHGYMHKQLGNYPKAKESYEIAAEIAHNSEYEDSERGPHIFRPLGNIYTRLGDYEKAIIFLGKSFEIAEEEAHYRSMANALSDIGIVYFSKGEIKKALETYQKAILLPELSAESLGLVYSNISAAYYELNQLDSAEWFALQTLDKLKLAEKETTRPKRIQAFRVGTYSTLGRIYSENGAFNTAQKHFANALKEGKKAYQNTRRRELAKVYLGIGDFHQKQDRHIDALMNYQNALLCVLPDYQAKDHLPNPNPKQFYAENSILEALEGKAKIWQLKYEKSKNIEDLKQAFECYKLAFAASEILQQSYQYESSKLILLDDRHSRTEKALEVAFSLATLSDNKDYFHQAFAFAEQAKAAVLLESLKALQAKTLVGVPDSLIVKEQQIREGRAYFQKAMLEEQLKGVKVDSTKWRWCQNELFILDQEWQQLVGNLKSNYPDYHRLKHDPVYATVEQIQDKLLNKKTAFVEYFMGDKNCYIFVITSNDFKVLKQPIQESFVGLVKNFLEDISLQENSNEIQNYKQHAFQLYKQLLQPLDLDKKRLIIVPDGVLGYLPFDALLSENSSENNLKRLPYLVKKHSISYAYSATVLLENKRKKITKTHKKPFLGFAPMFNQSKNFPFLQHSQNEVESIKKQFGGDTFIGNNATKDNFKRIANSYRILHLSTHAAVAHDAPLLSWISFADTSQTEGDFKLYLAELYAMQLQADLVVLSACETGIGNLQNGEGIMSLARGFAYAGSESILTTLWQVNHKSTTTIMEHFYTNLSKGLEKDLALQKAKLRYLNNEDLSNSAAHPYFWAAYVPIGNNKAINRKKNLYQWGFVIGILVLIGGGYFVWRNWK